MTDGINTLRYSDFFLAMYFDGGKSCLHRNHSHVLVYMYSGEMVIDEREKTTRLHKGDCAFIRKDFSVQMTKQAWNGEQFKAIFLMFTSKFLRGFYNRLDRDAIPKDAKRDEISLYKLPSNRPDIVSLFESMTPYFDSNIQPTEELLQLKMIEGIYVLLNTSKNLYASIFDFTDPWKIDILEFLESNYMNDISMQDSLVTYLKSVDGVREVKQSQQVANTLTDFNSLIGYISAGVILILLGVAVFLISNTVTVGIAVRREEIGIMKLIGATDYLVRAPFVVEGMVIGMIGAAIPLILLYFMYQKIIVYIAEKFNFIGAMINFVSVHTVFKTLVPVAIILGAGIGFLGSRMTIRKHLKV